MVNYKDPGYTRAVKSGPKLSYEGIIISNNRSSIISKLLEIETLVRAKNIKALDFSYRNFGVDKITNSISSDDK